MMSRAMIVLCALLGAAALPAGAGAQPRDQDSLGAAWGEQQDTARRCVQGNRCLPLAQVLDIIRRQTPGRQLDAGIEPGPGGRIVYRVRWAADNGKRLDYLVDAETGAIVRVEGR